MASAQFGSGGGFSSDFNQSDAQWQADTTSHACIHTHAQWQAG
jgi:hypothetical protein